MKIAILSCVLGNFDSPVDPVPQDLPNGVEEIVFHRFTDEDFPQIADLPPRFQYRIPKMFGWQMFPGYDVYIWLDGGMSLQRPDSVKWFMKQLADSDIAFFRHPWRGTVKQEVEHIEQKLIEGNKYITARYKGGLHREQYEQATLGDMFEDNNLYATTVFIYRNNEYSQSLMREWWYLQSRYYTCDQVNLPYAIHTVKNSYEADRWLEVNKIPDNLFKIGYVSLVSHHK